MPRPLRFVQPGTALAKKFHTLGCEFERRSRMALRRVHVTFGDKPLQVASLIAGEFGRIGFPDGAQERDFFVRQVAGDSVVSGSTLTALCRADIRSG